MTTADAFLTLGVLRVFHAVRRVFQPSHRGRTLSRLVVTLVGFSSVSAQLRAQGPVNVPTWRYDNTHGGANTQETLLNPSNVNVSSFGKLFSRSVDGYVYAQPLYIAGLTMGDGLLHNVLFVATEHDSVFAFDADSNGGANAQPLWQASLLTPAYGASAGATTVPSTDVGVADITPEIGITGTPAIDLAAQSIFVVSKTKENGAYIQRLHALNLITGAEQPNSPVVIQASVHGTGNGSSGGVLSFDSLWQNQRTALNYDSGYVNIAWGAHGDNGPWHGWILAYNAVTLAQTGVLCLSPNGGGNGLWESGAGLAIDHLGPNGSGRMFPVAGNGSYSVYPPYANAGYGNSIVDISLANGALTPVDAFTPFNQAKLSASDEDQGSGGVVLLPTQQGSYPNVLVQIGKEGRILVLNRDKLGGYAPGGTSNPNALQDTTGMTGGLWSTPAYWNGNLYVWGNGDYARMFAVNAGVVTTPASSTSSRISPFPGASFVISSSGTQNGIAWAVRTDSYRSNGPAVLYAFDATNLKNGLYESDTNSARDSAGPATKFVVPVVTNGKVYVGAAYEVDVYGLLNGAPMAATPVISPNGGSFTSAQTITLTTATSGAAIYYTLDGSTPTATSNVYGGPFTLSSAATVKAIASEEGYLQSPVASAAFAFQTQTPPPALSPAPGTFTAPQPVTLSDTDASAAIYYTLDGTTPTAASARYTAPFSVSAASTTVEAIAIDPAFQPSSVAGGVYAIQPVVNFPNGFSSVAGLTLNGNAINTDDSRLQLSSGATYQDSSVYYSQPVNIQAFTTSFQFQLSNAVGDGFTFTIQNSGVNALGTNGGGLGYKGIGKSVAVKFDFANNAGEGTDSTGIYINGANPTVPAVSLASSGIVLKSGHAMQAQLVYNGATLTLTLTDVVNNATFTLSQAINIPQTVGGNTAWVGFTGATGGSSSSQKVLTWTYNIEPPTTLPAFSPAGGSYAAPQAVALTDASSGATIYYTTDGTAPTTGSPVYSAPIAIGYGSTTLEALAVANGIPSPVATAAYTILPSATVISYPNGFSSVAGLQVNGNGAVTGNVLELANASSQASSVYYATPVNVQAFTTSFTFQFKKAKGDGLTFTIQNAGPTALGKNGGALGYGSPSKPGGIGQSVAVKFDIFSNQGEGTDSTGLYTNGAYPTVPAVDMTSSGVILLSGDPMLAQLAYNGTTLALTLTDTVTHAVFTTSFTVNIPQVVGGNTAYVGFTGGTGGNSSIQDILSWTYTTGMPANKKAAADPCAPGCPALPQVGWEQPRYDLRPVSLALSRSYPPHRAFLVKDYNDPPSGAPAVTAEPRFSPKPGKLAGTTNVTLRSATANAEIHYTVDGAQPTRNSPIYHAPIVVSGTALTIKAFARAPGRKDSPVVTGNYHIAEDGD